MPRHNRTALPLRRMVRTVKIPLVETTAMCMDMRHGETIVIVIASLQFRNYNSGIDVAMSETDGPNRRRRCGTSETSVRPTRAFLETGRTHDHALAHGLQLDHIPVRTARRQTKTIAIAILGHGLVLGHGLQAEVGVATVIVKHSLDGEDLRILPLAKAAPAVAAEVEVVEAAVVGVILSEGVEGRGPLLETTMLWRRD
jgi:hypothetical protein